MKQSIFFIDGFNLYHAISNSFDHEKYKWLDLRFLSEKFIDKDEEIKGIYYFTAYCSWNKRKKYKHEKYIKALISMGVEVVLGNFKNVTKRYVRSKMEVIDPLGVDIDMLPREFTFKSKEEKETDENIAVKMMELAFFGKFDKFYIISGDSDFVPAIKSVKRHFPNIRFVNILPINSNGKTLGQVCDKQVKMEEIHLKESLLPDIVGIGRNIIEKPESWC